jgi:hypothetical protein
MRDQIPYKQHCNEIFEQKSCKSSPAITCQKIMVQPLFLLLLQLLMDKVENPSATVLTILYIQSHTQKMPNISVYIPQQLS